jgi:hypothetical protein
MRGGRFPLLLVITPALLISSVSATPLQSTNGDCRYFAETGHYVCNEFLEFFEARGGLEIFGYPLTEAFDDPAFGMRVQYFQSARMEWHPYNAEPYRVLLGLLVDELGYEYPDATQVPPANSNLHHYFPETKHVVSYEFLHFFRQKGGLDIFGYPRSEFVYEDGHIVQYFQRARMEWHPEAATGPQMRLTKLGETYIERFGVPEGADQPVPAPIIEGAPSTEAPERKVMKLNLTASVRNVITGREGSQTVFVYVTDQRQQPVSGAAVEMVVHYPAGDQHYGFEPTNASGFTNASFEILPAPPGRKVVVDVTVTYYDGSVGATLTGTTQTFFLPWW